MTSRNQQIMDFFKEAEKLKLVYRQTWLSDESRQESDAEHSWHLALMLLLFEKDMPADFDMLKAVKIALFHDLVEISAGDTFVFDEAANVGKKERELKAAKELFARLPADLEKEFMDLFLEFEACETPEARFVQSFDKIHPGITNNISNGHGWKKHNITLAKVDGYKRHMMEHHPLAMELYENMFQEAKDKGLLK